MSRLDSVIRRLIAQRDILNHVEKELDLPENGAILEFGLGNGRTYHHLRELFPNRRIIAFDWAVGAHKSSIPADEDLILGEIRETGKAFIGRNAALAHADIGTAYEDIDAQTQTWLPALMAGVLSVGGICVSGLALTDNRFRQLPIPDGIAPDRYFLYRRV